MKLKFKLLPAIMTVLSVLYLVYVISSENTTLVADTVGGDPGGKLLPIIIAIFLIAGFLFITLKERPTEEKMNKETASLFFITLGAAISYVLLTKTIGFIILSTLLLYSLEYLYTTIGEKRKPLEATIGGLITIISTVGFYTLMKFMARALARMARNGMLPDLFGNSTVIAVICLGYVLIIVTLLSLTLGRFLSRKKLNRSGNAGIITLAVVLIIYVVFKQFFLVGLAPGLLNY